MLSVHVQLKPRPVDAARAVLAVESVSPEDSDRLFAAADVNSDGKVNAPPTSTQHCMQTGNSPAVINVTHGSVPGSVSIDHTLSKCKLKGSKLSDTQDLHIGGIAGV